MNITEQYFLEEVNRFREACGDKSFWEKTEKQHSAMISGLSFCYLNITNEDGSRPTPEQIEDWGQIFLAALDNYNRRKVYMDLLPLRKALELV